VCGLICLCQSFVDWNLGALRALLKYINGTECSVYLCKLCVMGGKKWPFCKKYPTWLFHVKEQKGKFEMMKSWEK